MDSHRIAKLSLQVIAGVCIYLILSISFASAIQITIYRQIMKGRGVTVTGEKQQVTLDAGVLVDKDFEFVHDPTDRRWENVQVKIEVIGRDPDYSIKKIYLFKCKDTNPLDCVDYEPIEADSYLSGEKGTLYWRDVSRGRKANFLILIKFNHEGTDFWTGFWDEATRAGTRDFNHKTYDLSHIDFYAKPGIEPKWVKDFINEYYVLPANWMQRAVLGTVNGEQTKEIYEILANKTELDVPYFEKYKPSTRIIERVRKDFLLAFARGSISNPVTFFSNPLPTCGDDACDVGESPSSCCLDCGCASGQDCSANSDHPNGLCHVCGDGSIAPVENSTNCCVDAGCAEGLYCDNTMNVPYGKCVSPACGNNDCEPSEDSGNCPVDCWNTPGKRCSDVYGSRYYYNSETQECILPECGERDCEPGESYSNCCTDCECPTGQYCKTDEVAAGVCMAATCGNANCEPGEDYSNCCTDCGNCPVDQKTGELQVCTQNVCHLCGNGVIESPVETPQTCCQDTGCLNGYCSVGGACKSESDMGLAVRILPETVDCTQGGEVDIRFTLVNGPAFLESFESVAYTYQNSRFRLSQCIQQGNIFMCKLPLTGPETFPGCFEEGAKNVVFNTMLTYFEDNAGKVSNEIKYHEVSAPFSFEVIKARPRVCNKNGACEPGVGESPDFCCWDCMCEGGLVCTGGGCKNENLISLAVNPEDLPARNNIDCMPKNGMQPTDEFKFKAHVQNVPESAYESFNVLNWKLEYMGKTYTAQNIPGFMCRGLTTMQGHHTGDVECSIPVAMFPACPNPPPADMKLTLNILGGGLLGHYAPYEGKPVSSQFLLDYVQGLPMCGNGEQNPEMGETQDNCCRDMGCPESGVCTLYSGCVSESEVDIKVTIDPQNVDCTREANEDRGRKKVIILAEVTKKPFSPSTAGIEFGDAYLDDSRIEEMGGLCEPVVNSTIYSVYAWRCHIPVADFNPFCWVAGDYNPEFETTISWQNINGNRITKKVKKPVSFSVELARERKCLPDGYQDPEFGEIIDQCCPDAGCSGDKVCTKDIVCVDSSDISLVIDDVSPDALDCSVKDDPENKVVITVHIDNMPYHTQYVEWFMRHEDDTFTEQYFSCHPVSYEDLRSLVGRNQTTLQSNTYKCEMPVHFFPACAKAGPHNLDLIAMIIHNDYKGQIFRNEVTSPFTVNVGKEGLPNCKDGVCQKNLGETSDNCCMDCGCGSEEQVCAIDGSCYAASEITMSVEPPILSTKCQLSPWDMDTYAVKSYQCIFQEPLKLKAHLSHKPWQSSIISTSYIWDTEEEAYSDSISPGEEIADGWNLHVMLNPSGSYVVKSFSGDKRTSKHTMRDISLTLQLPAHQGDYERVVKVESTNDVRVTVNEIKDEDLLELEKALKDMKEAMEKARRTVCTIVTILAICTMCSLMAGGAVDTVAKAKGEEAAQEARGSLTPEQQRRYNELKRRDFGDVSDLLSTDEYRESIDTVEEQVENLNTAIEEDTELLDTVYRQLQMNREHALRDIAEGRPVSEHYRELSNEYDEINRRLSLNPGYLRERQEILSGLQSNLQRRSDYDEYSDLFERYNRNYLREGRSLTMDWEDRLQRRSRTYGRAPLGRQARRDLRLGTGAPTDAQIIEYGQDRIRERGRQEFLNSIAPRQPLTFSGRGRLPMGMFNYLMSVTQGMNGLGAGIVGGLAGLAFLWAESKMLQCEDSMKNAIMIGGAICGGMLMGPVSWQSFLIKIAKICDLLSVALQYMMLINDLNNQLMQYEACMMAAEAEIARRPARGETGYDRSRRIANYYRQLAACHQGLESGTTRLMDRWADMSENLAMWGSQWSGSTRTGMREEPTFGSEVGPGTTIRLSYNFPGYRGRGNFGQINIVFNGRYRHPTYGSFGGGTVAHSFRVETSSGTVLCPVNEDGLSCTLGSQRRVLEIPGCAQAARGIVWPGARRTGAGAVGIQEICREARLTGTITVTWTIAGSQCPDCSGYYSFNSRSTAGLGGAEPGQPGAPGQGAPGTGMIGCCETSSACFHEAGLTRGECNVVDGEWSSNEVCINNQCSPATNFCSDAPTCQQCVQRDPGGFGSSVRCIFCETSRQNNIPQGTCRFGQCQQNERTLTTGNQCTGAGCRDGHDEDCEYLDDHTDSSGNVIRTNVCYSGQCVDCMDYGSSCQNCLTRNVIDDKCQWDKTNGRCVRRSIFVQDPVTNINACDRECSRDSQCDGGEICTVNGQCIDCSNYTGSSGVPDCQRCTSQPQRAEGGSSCIWEWQEGGNAQCLKEYGTARNWQNYYVSSYRDCFKNCDSFRQCATTDQWSDWACDQNICKSCTSYNEAQIDNCGACASLDWCKWETPTDAPSYLANDESRCVGKDWPLQEGNRRIGGGRSVRHAQTESQCPESDGGGTTTGPPENARVISAGWCTGQYHGVQGGHNVLRRSITCTNTLDINIDQVLWIVSGGEIKMANASKIAVNVNGGRLVIISGSVKHESTQSRSPVIKVSNGGTVEFRGGNIRNKGRASALSIEGGNALIMGGQLWSDHYDSISLHNGELRFEGGSKAASVWASEVQINGIPLYHGIVAAQGTTISRAPDFNVQLTPPEGDFANQLHGQNYYRQCTGGIRDLAGQQTRGDFAICTGATSGSATEIRRRA